MKRVRSEFFQQKLFLSFKFFFKKGIKSNREDCECHCQTLKDTKSTYPWLVFVNIMEEKDGEDYLHSSNLGILVSPWYVLTVKNGIEDYPNPDNIVASIKYNGHDYGNTLTFRAEELIFQEGNSSFVMIKLKKPVDIGFQPACIKDHIFKPELSSFVIHRKNSRKTNVDEIIPTVLNRDECDIKAPRSIRLRNVIQKDDPLFCAIVKNADHLECKYFFTVISVAVNWRPTIPFS